MTLVLSYMAALNAEPNCLFLCITVYYETKLAPVSLHYKSCRFQTANMIFFRKVQAQSRSICHEDAPKLSRCLGFQWSSESHLYIKIGLSRCVSTGVAWMDGRSRAAGTGGKRYKQDWADEGAGRRASRLPKSSRYVIIIQDTMALTAH